MDCWVYRRISDCWNIWSQSVDIDQAFGNDYTGNANALFDMIDWSAVEVEFPTAADIAAQCEAATIGDERACFVDSAADGGHALALTGELSANPLYLLL